MNSKLDELFLLLKRNLRRYFSISFFIFLFILFFQPFPIDGFDFDNRVIFVAGFALIIFIVTILVRISLAILYPTNNQAEWKNDLNPFISAFSMTVLSGVAGAFYIHYVGHVPLTIYILFKLLLVCLAAPVTVRIYDRFDETEEQNRVLLSERKAVQKQVERYEEDILNKSISFVSENENENITLLILDVALIRSADNYVEIIYREEDVFRKRLIRNTMKNVEQQLKLYSNFIRCHRICIVNSHFIEKLNKSLDRYWISIKGFEEKIPVSRQYLLKIKEIL